MQTGTHDVDESDSSPDPRAFPTAESMKQRADDATDRIADRAHEKISRLSGKIQPTVDALSEKASHAMDRASHRAGQLRDTGDAALQSTRHYVRENPILAIGIAAIIGLLVGRSRR